MSSPIAVQRQFSSGERKVQIVIPQHYNFVFSIAYFSIHFTSSPFHNTNAIYIKLFFLYPNLISTFT